MLEIACLLSLIFTARLWIFLACFLALLVQSIFAILSSDFPLPDFHIFLQYVCWASGFRDCMNCSKLPTWFCFLSYKYFYSILPCLFLLLVGSVLAICLHAFFLLYIAWILDSCLLLLLSRCIKAFLELASLCSCFPGACILPIWSLVFLVSMCRYSCTCLDVSFFLKCSISPLSSFLY